MTFTLFLNYAGIAVFAAAGALAASRKELDIISFIFLACITGVGGGTFRDLLLNTPIFWIENPVNITVCVAAAVLVYFTAHLVESRYKLLLWLDALGLAAFSVIGAAKGFTLTGSPTVAIICGMLTGTFGGILRDMLAHEPSVLLRQEIYVTAALAGAVAYIALKTLGVPLDIAMGVAMAISFIIRGGALKYGWGLKRYKPRPGRRPEDIP